MALTATQIRRGMVLVFEGDPCRVVEFRHHTPGNLRAMVQAKLKNLRTGSSFDHRFRAADTIEKASMETIELDFMYKGGDSYHFMNTSNYDQLEMDEEALGDSAPWMQEGMKILAEYYNGRPIGIELPNSMVLEIVDTAPVFRGATKTASSKPAKLSNGVTVNVPFAVEPITISGSATVDFRLQLFGSWCGLKRRVQVAREVRCGWLSFERHGDRSSTG